MSSEPADVDPRFGGMVRLYGREAFDRIRALRLCVIGLGGVGSWTVEALARTGVGSLRLIDFDDVCVSNTNRQLHAHEGNYGRPKAEALAQRARLINPAVQVEICVGFYSPTTADKLLCLPCDGIVDAVDDVPAKCHLIAEAKRRGIPIVASGGAGGRRDPTQVEVADLALSHHDKLLQEVRKRLRRDFGFPTKEKEPFGVECVFSAEPMHYPSIDGGVCDTRDPEVGAPQRGCEGAFGTASFVTGTFGFAAAARLIEVCSRPSAESAR